MLHDRRERDAERVQIGEQRGTQDAVQLGVAVTELRPLLSGEFGRSRSWPVCRSVYIGQGDQVRGVHRGGNPATCRHSASAASRASAPRCRAVRGGAGEGEAAAAELVAQLLGVGRQVAEGAELDGGVAGRDGLVEEAVPGHLLGVVGEPDAQESGAVPSRRLGSVGSGWVVRSRAMKDVLG